jgi:outer membrane protein assembly factor BamB
MHRKLPAPKPKEPGPDADERLSRSGPWAVGALILVLAGTAWAMNVNYRSTLPGTLEELVALRERNDNGQRHDEPTTDVAKLPTIPDLPTSEQRRANWPNFRGPHGSGVSAYANVPTEWDGATDQGILWKTSVPLPGVNSPIVWQDRVFLSGATQDAREVYCFDAATGSILWNRQVAAALPEGDRKLKTTADTGWAAPSMATDGRFAFVIFADGVVAAFDFAGHQIWRRHLGVPQKNNYGHASSLTTHRGFLIVQFDQGVAADKLSKLLALDGATGESVWETIRPVPASWSSPIVIEHNGQPQIITCGDPWVIAYSAQDGAEVWRAKCLERAEVGVSPVYSDGLVFAGNDGAALAAMRADGSGDVTDTHVMWTVDFGLPDICSPLATKDFILTLTSFGTLTCLDKFAGGDPLWEEDFEADFMSSPSLVGDLVYLFSKAGAAWIVEPSRAGCQRIATAELGEECVTSPAFQDGRIYIRGREHLFCLGEATAERK